MACCDNIVGNRKEALCFVLFAEICKISNEHKMMNRLLRDRRRVAVWYLSLFIGIAEPQRKDVETGGDSTFFVSVYIIIGSRERRFPIDEAR